MFEQLKRWRLRRSQKRSSHIGTFVGYQSIKKVLILFESDDNGDNENIHEMIRPLIESGREIVTIGILNKKESSSSPQENKILFGSKDINFWGKPKSGILDQIKDNKFDIVINLMSESIIALEYLQIQFPEASLWTGKSQVSNVYDFVIDLSANGSLLQSGLKNYAYGESSYLFEQILHYLQIIQPKETKTA